MSLRRRTSEFTENSLHVDKSKWYFELESHVYLEGDVN